MVMNDILIFFQICGDCLLVFIFEGVMELVMDFISEIRFLVFDW